jgi:hypothetical protein
MLRFRLFLLEELAGPIVRRSGTALASFLLGVGITSHQTDLIVSGAITAALVSIDLIGSHIVRRSRP